MIMKLCMEQYVLKLCKVYVNDDPELTLTHFKTVKFGETCFCTYSRPRYQVSVYRTIGPLVCSGLKRTLVLMATYCFYRLLIGKVKIDNFPCYNGDNWNLFFL